MDAARNKKLDAMKVKEEISFTREEAQKQIKGQLNIDIDILGFDDAEISKLIWILKQIT